MYRKYRHAVVVVVVSEMIRLKVRTTKTTTTTTHHTHTRKLCIQIRKGIAVRNSAHVLERLDLEETFVSP